MATLSLPANVSVASVPPASKLQLSKGSTVNDYFSGEDPICRYGDIVDAVYQIIDDKQEYPDIISLYGKSTVLQKSGMPLLHENYTVTRYLYATVKGVKFFSVDIDASVAYFGFVAVSKDEQTKRLGYREIVVAIRGTCTIGEWIADANSLRMVPARFLPRQKDAQKNPWVHPGFLSIYTSTDGSLEFGTESLQTQISKEIHAQLQLAQQDVKIVFTGHSLGSALATLAAADHSVNRSSITGDVNVMISLVVFASPKVGDENFKALVEASGLDIKRYSGVFDIVPMVPVRDVDQRWYEHVGPELCPLWIKSDYVDVKKLVDALDSALKNWIDTATKLGAPLKQALSRYHNLQLYMHAIAATSFSDVKTVDATHLEAPITTKLKEWFSFLFGSDSVLKLATYFNQMAGAECSLPSDKQKAKRIKTFNSPFDRRDLALLNKDSDALEPNYRIPENWCVPPNKDMVWSEKFLKWLPRCEREDDIPDSENPEYN